MTLPPRIASRCDLRHAARSAALDLPERLVHARRDEQRIGDARDLFRVAPGPFFAQQPSAGISALLTAPRLFHPLRVAPLFAVWLLMLRSTVRRFVTIRVSVHLAPTAHAS